MKIQITCKTPPKPHKNVHHVFSPAHHQIPPQETVAIPLALTTSFPSNFVVILRSLSPHLISTAGVIDSDFRGDICLIAYNYTNSVVTVQESEAVAQFVFLRCVLPTLHVVDKMEVSERGTSGIGSTGLYDSNLSKKE